MIQANELRIGNWINDPKGKGYNNPGFIKVASIRNGKINEWQDMGASGFISEDDAEPIPLTPEILEKCGFHNQGDQRYYIFHNDRVLFSCWLKDYTINVDGSFMPARVQYLHQLQNLYFALTSEELNIQNLISKEETV